MGDDTTAAKSMEEQAVKETATAKRTPSLQETATAKRTPSLQETATAKSTPSLQDTAKSTPSLQETATAKSTPSLQDTAKSTPSLQETATAKSTPSLHDAERQVALHCDASSDKTCNANVTSAKVCDVKSEAKIDVPSVTDSPTPDHLSVAGSHAEGASVSLRSVSNLASCLSERDGKIIRSDPVSTCLGGDSENNGSDKMTYQRDSSVSHTLSDSCADVSGTQNSKSNAEVAGNNHKAVRNIRASVCQTSLQDCPVAMVTDRHTEPVLLTERSVERPDPVTDTSQTSKNDGQDSAYRKAEKRKGGPCSVDGCVSTKPAKRSRHVPPSAESSSHTSRELTSESANKNSMVRSQNIPALNNQALSATRERRENATEMSTEQKGDSTQGDPLGERRASESFKQPGETDRTQGDPLGERRASESFKQPGETDGTQGDPLRDRRASESLKQPGETNRLKCQLCGFVFTREHNLARHVKKIHKTARGELHPTAHDFLLSMARHHFPCSVCGAHFSQPTELARHVKLTHRKKTVVKHDQPETQPTGLARDVKLTHRKKTVIRHDKPESQPPVKSQHPSWVDNDMNEKPFRCSVCDGSFMSAAYLSQHKKLVHRNTLGADHASQTPQPQVESKSEPGSVESRSEPGSVESRSEPGSLESRSEPGSVESRSEPGSVESRSEPGSVESRSEAGSVKCFNCRKCGESFFKAADFARHVKHTHRRRRAVDRKVPTFRSVLKKADGVRLVISVKPFDCGQCGASFCEAVNLSRHVKLAHRGVSPETGSCPLPQGGEESTGIAVCTQSTEHCLPLPQTDEVDRKDRKDKKDKEKQVAVMTYRPAQSTEHSRPQLQADKEDKGGKKDRKDRKDRKNRKDKAKQVAAVMYRSTQSTEHSRLLPQGDKGGRKDKRVRKDKKDKLKEKQVTAVSYVSTQSTEHSRLLPLGNKGVKKDRKNKEDKKDRKNRKNKAKQVAEDPYSCELSLAAEVSVKTVCGPNETTSLDTARSTLPSQPAARKSQPHSEGAVSMNVSRKMLHVNQSESDEGGKHVLPSQGNGASQTGPKLEEITVKYCGSKRDQVSNDRKLKVHRLKASTNTLEPSTDRLESFTDTLESSTDMLKPSTDMLESSTDMLQSSTKSEDIPRPPCTEKFTKQRKLKRHMFFIHNPHKSSAFKMRCKLVHCFQCPAKFTTPLSLTRHTQVAHPTHTTSSYHTRNSISTPEPVVSKALSLSDKNFPFTCSVCAKIFSSVMSLERHKSNVRACLKRCERNSLLVASSSKHRQTQNRTDADRDGNLSCRECGVRLSTLHNLRRHVSQIHNHHGKVTSGGAKVSKRTARSKWTGKRKNVVWECDTCGGSFSTEYNLKRHVANLHSQQPSQPQPSVATFNLPWPGDSTGGIYSYTDIAQPSLLHTVVQQEGTTSQSLLDTHGPDDVVSPTVFEAADKADSRAVIFEPSLDDDRTGSVQILMEKGYLFLSSAGEQQQSDTNRVKEETSPQPGVPTMGVDHNENLHLTADGRNQKVWCKPEEKCGIVGSAAEPERLAQIKVEERITSDQAGLAVSLSSMGCDQSFTGVKTEKNVASVMPADTSTADHKTEKIITSVMPTDTRTADHKTEKNITSVMPTDNRTADHKTGKNITSVMPTDYRTADHKTEKNITSVMPTDNRTADHKTGKNITSVMPTDNRTADHKTGKNITSVMPTDTRTADHKTEKNITSVMPTDYRTADHKTEKNITSVMPTDTSATGHSQDTKLAQDTLCATLGSEADPNTFKQSIAKEERVCMDRTDSVKDKATGISLPITPCRVVLVDIRFAVNRLQTMGK